MAGIGWPAVRPGDPAPDFSVAAVDRPGTISLADYRGRSPVLLAILRGLWCSFCRRYIVQLGGARERLEPLGIDTLAIVASDRERVRLYLRHRPARVPLAADPEMVTHRAYGLPTSPRTAEIDLAWAQMRARVDEFAVNPADSAQLTTAIQSAQEGPTAEAEQRLSVWALVHATRSLYPYEMTESEQQHRARNEALETGQFLIDRDGVIRWIKLQRATEAPTGLGNYPSEDEILAAAREL